jgi:hypothetical protein
MVPTAVRHPRSIWRSSTAFSLVTALALTACTGPEREEQQPPVTVSPGPDERVLAGSLHGRTGAYLTMREAASRIEVRLAELPGLLYRISTPAGSGLAPHVTGPSGRVRLGLRATGDDGPDSARHG